MKDKIKQARLEASLTQAELAEKIGVLQKDISRYERGERKPKFDKLVLIAKATNKPLDFFVEGDD
jgi:transcriptional regulator with XRE-family HTH domain